jgi:hypothetical protein
MSALPSSLRSVRIAVSLGCPGCARPIALDAIGDRARCRACLCEVPLARATWAGFAARPVARALDGEAAGRSTDFDRYTVVTRIALAPPTCRCGAAIDLDAPACGCGAPIAIRRRADAGDAWLPGAIHRQVVAVVGERALTPIAACAPVAFRCGCGAGLTTDGSTRAVGCGRCGLVDVPVGLWDALHPTVAAAAIYALIEVAS